MKHIQKWVKQFFSVKEYNDYYQFVPAYCFLEKVAGRGVWLGVMVADTVPADCQLMTDEECYKVDEYRKANKVYPTPLEVVEK